MRANPYEDRDPQTSTNNRILNAAARLFYREGIRAVSVDQVAAEASVTKVTVYKHYCAKDELLAACWPYSTSLTCGGTLARQSVNQANHDLAGGGCAGLNHQGLRPSPGQPVAAWRAARGWP